MKAIRQSFQKNAQVCIETEVPPGVKVESSKPAILKFDKKKKKHLHMKHRRWQLMPLCTTVEDM